MWQGLRSFWRANSFLLLGFMFAFLGFVAPFIFIATSSGFTVAGAFAHDSVRLSAWLLSLACFLIVFVCVGLAVNGRPMGVLIDERNRYSLSRFQITLWTVLLLPSVYVILIANLQRGANELQSVDWNLFYLLGISIGSVVAGPMIFSLKPQQSAGSAEVAAAATQLRESQNLSTTVGAKGRLVKKSNAMGARLSDLIRGEEIDNVLVVDIPRVQMLIITGTVFAAYGYQIAQVIAGKDAVILDFPPLNQVLLGLILVSHGGYLAGKLTPTAGSKADTSRQLARALQLSQRATDLVRGLEQKQAAAPGDPNWQGLLAIARALAADAAALPGLVGTDKFSEETLGKLEGKFDALVASQANLDGPAGVAGRDVLEAPAAGIVRQVQQKLMALQLSATALADGIPDAATSAAIDKFLAKLGVTRSMLSPRPYRFYEEVLALMP